MTDDPPGTTRPDPAADYANPHGVRGLSQDDLGHLGLSREGELYWHGKPVQTEQRVGLKNLERYLAAIVAAAAVVSAVAQVIALFM